MKLNESLFEDSNMKKDEFYGIIKLSNSYEEYDDKVDSYQVEKIVKDAIQKQSYLRVDDIKVDPYEKDVEGSTIKVNFNESLTESMRYTAQVYNTNTLEVIQKQGDIKEPLKYLALDAIFDPNDPMKLEDVELTIKDNKTGEIESIDVKEYEGKNKSYAQPLYDIEDKFNNSTKQMHIVYSDIDDVHYNDKTNDYVLSGYIIISEHELQSDTVKEFIAKLVKADPIDVDIINYEYLKDEDYVNIVFEIHTNIKYLSEFERLAFDREAHLNMSESVYNEAAPTMSDLIGNLTDNLPQDKLTKELRILNRIKKILKSKESDIVYYIDSSTEFFYSPEDYSDNAGATLIDRDQIGNSKLDIFEVDNFKFIQERSEGKDNFLWFANENDLIRYIDYVNNRNALDEKLNESFEGPATAEDTGIASLLISEINGEWETIDKYNALLEAIKTIDSDIDKEAMIKVIEDINTEEHKHIGQLQELLKTISPVTNEIENGQDEAAEQISEVE